MKNIRDLFRNSWTSLYSQHQHGQRIKKQHLQELIKNKEPLNDDGWAFLESLLSGEIKFSTGNTKKIDERYVEMCVVMKVMVFEDTLINSKGLRGERSVREEAKEKAAKAFCISVREVETYLGKHEEEIRHMLPQS